MSKTIAEWNVTQKNIDLGICNAEECPISRSRRGVITYQSYLLDQGVQYWLTPSLEEWVDDYDHGRKVDPITVVLFEEDGKLWAGIK